MIVFPSGSYDPTELAAYQLIDSSEGFWLWLRETADDSAEIFPDMRIFRIILPVLALVFASLTRSQEFYVAPAGSDANAGSASAPFQTLARAQLAVRSLSLSERTAHGGVTVWIEGGSYDLASTLEFDASDSGTAEAPITYQGRDGVTARITGAMQLDPSWFTLVDANAAVWNRLDNSARGQVYVADLRSHGISDYGVFKPRGFSLHASAPMELSINGRPMVLGRWPNQGQTLAKTAGTPSATQITYSGDRPSRWTLAPDAWVQGLWAQSWADFHLPIASIAPASNTITLGYAPDQYGLGSNRPFYAYNLLEEIDTPGEYYLDRVAGKIYVWPEEPLMGSTIEVSRLEAPVIRTNGTRYVRFKNLIVESTRATLLEIKASEHVTVENCVLRNAGQSAASIDGANCGLDHCQVLESGEEGVRLFGGDRASLTPSHNFVTNSRLVRAGRISWTYKPGVSIEAGCGSEVSHNFFDDMPHAAIIFSGNNHVMDFNEILRVCASTGDAGAIYTSRGWGTRGNAIRNNFIHHIASTQSDGAHGIYLDDCASGIEVTGNILYSIANTAIFLGGGRDNLVRNNIIAASGVAHFNDDRGRSRMNNRPGDYWNLLERLGDDGVHYQQSPWANAFPACAAIPNNWSAIQQGRWRNPEGCVFSQNVGWGNKSWALEDNSSQTGVFSVYAAMASNQPASPALFDESVALDRSLRPSTLSGAVAGFAAIPFRSIGMDVIGTTETAAPALPILTGKAESPSVLSVTWTNVGALANNRPDGFDLQVLDAASQIWATAQSFDSNASLAQVAGLKAGTNYSLRVRAFNQAGAVFSNVLTLSTSSVLFSAGPPIRVEAEDNYTVSADVGSNGSVGVSDGNLDSGRSVRLYDTGDAIRVAFKIPADGTYRLGARVRAGGITGPMGYWPNGYRFALDNGAITLTGDASTLSELDSAYGGCFWGTMLSEPTKLSAGSHVMEIAAASTWAVADYVEYSLLTAVGGGNTTVANPTLKLPADIVTEATSAQGAVVSFQVSAQDGMGATLSVLTSAPTNTTFPLGQTVVVATATDAGGRTSSGKFNITVRDTTAPALLVPETVIVEAKSSSGTAVTFEIKATDLVSPMVNVDSTPKSGTTFPMGNTTVSCRAVDAAGNASDKQFTVIVRDSTPPNLSALADITVTTANVAGSVVNFSPTATDLVSGPCVITSFPRSGSLFPVGSTLVQVTAADAAGNTVTKNFSVKVMLAALSNPILAAVASTQSATLSWDAAVGVSYDVKRSNSGTGPFTAVGENLNQASFVDSDVSSGQTYYYLVTAKQVGRTSVDSAIVGVTILGDTSTWISSDVGSVNFAGSTTIDGNGFSVTASGADIWGNRDAFRYVAKTITGNGVIEARVTGVQYTSDWAKAGVMMRETLAANSAFVAVYITPGHGVVLQWRGATGAECSSIDGGGAYTPCWLRLIRAGDTFAASRSNDGRNWTSVGNVNLNLASQIKEGLAVTSHADWSLNRATFDHVDLTNVETSDVVLSRVEAENGFEVIADVGGNGRIGIADGNLDSDRSVTLYDNGDAIRLPFTIADAGMFRIRARVRSGGSTGNTAFWPGGYRFRVDGIECRFSSEAATLSGYDSSYGGCYWGTMTGDVIALAPGKHTVDIIANSNWAVADYIEVVGSR